MTAKDINGNEIKVGDTVERVGGGDDLLVQRGNKYVVKKIRNRMKSWLFFVGVSDDYLSTNFKVIPSKKKPFTKSDLKDGMVVTYRDGRTRCLLNDQLYYLPESWAESYNQLSSLRSFKDDLTAIDSTNMDIVKVTYMDEVLWEREEPLTQEQLRIKELEEGIAKMQGEMKTLLKGE